VDIEMMSAPAGAGPMKRAMRRLAPGRYDHGGGELAISGTWRTELRARIGDFDRIVRVTQVEVR
jgi:hypothetical protein